MIVDASVAFKWFASEAGSDQAAVLLADNALTAPTLLLVEVASALWKKAKRDQIDPAVSFAQEVGELARLVSIRSETAIVGRALEIARMLDHPIYDCVYLALAEDAGERLVTADVRFATIARAAGFGDHIEVLS